MRVLKKLYGQRFGRLIAIEPSGYTKSKRIAWKCKCDCGAETIVASDKLISGHTKSCGCLISERAIESNKARTKDIHPRLYRIYYGMMSRCNNHKYDAYKHYGARGIKVCKEWSDSFYVFQDWALTHGYDDALTIDRINNDGNYEPLNCRWVDMKIQSNNRHPIGWHEAQKQKDIHNATDHMKIASWAGCSDAPDSVPIKDKKGTSK